MYQPQAQQWQPQVQQWQQPQQQAWGGAGYQPEPQAPEPPPQPVGKEGFHRLSKRIFIVPDETAASVTVEELNEVWSMSVSEKSVIEFDPTGWDEEAAFHAASGSSPR